MFLKNWFVISALGAIGLALLFFWFAMPSTPEGVTPQSDEDDVVKAIAALAGAITTLGTAVFGILGKLNDFRAKRIAIAKAEIELKKMQQEHDAQ